MLHRAGRRTPRPVLPDAGRPGRRRGHPDDRRAGAARRNAPSPPGSLPATSRAAVRVLHPRLPDGRPPHLPPGGHHERSGIAEGPQRPALSVHRLRGHPGGRPRGSGDRGRTMTTRMFGQPIPRLEDPRLLTGRGRYTDDFEHHAAHAAFVRTDFAHARILGVDVSAAASLPGVLGVFTHADLEGQFAEPLPLLIPNDGLTEPRTQRALALDEVCYAGETVA